jgi:hypothetical protein
MIDELIEQRFNRVDPMQQQIIERYCEGVYTKLRMAESKSEAITIVETACGQFDSTCESDILRPAVRRYLLDIIDHDLRPPQATGN